jgi:ribosomal protein S7
MATKTQKKSVQKDVGTYSALEAVEKSEGGQIILAGLRKDIVSAIDTLSSKYKDASYEILVALSAKISVSLALYRLITRANKNKKMAVEELTILLNEHEDEE